MSKTYQNRANEQSIPSVPPERIRDEARRMGNLRSITLRKQPVNADQFFRSNNNNTPQPSLPRQV